MSKDQRGADRRIEAERLWLERAWSDAEMADRMGVNRRTVSRWRDQLGDDKFTQPEYGKYQLDKRVYITQLNFSHHEALMLYLSARRQSQQTRAAHQHTADALSKLALALAKPMTEKLVQNSYEILNRQNDPLQQKVLETLVQGWLDNRVVEIDYRAARDNKSRKHRIKPFLIEPAVWSDSIYVIAASDQMQGQIQPFKTERIAYAHLSLETFNVPNAFDDEALLRHAWGVWTSQNAPTLVKLKFAAGLPSRRVNESLWHPLQTITSQDDGSCIWEAAIAEPLEMLPWIRGWGSDVEVLEPAGLRSKLINDVEAQSFKYGTPNLSTRQPYQWLYAKTDKENPNNIHLLLYHLIDVGMVTKLIWRQVLTQSIKTEIADLLGLTVDQTETTIAFWASLHDLGKASPSYQKKYSPQWLKDKIVESGLLIDSEYFNSKTRNPKTSHANVTTAVLTPLLLQYCDVPKLLAQSIAQALGGHHGVWPKEANTHQICDSDVKTWDVARKDLLWELRSVFQPSPITHNLTGENLNRLMTIFSGLVSVADWLGSREDAFPLIKQVISTREYAQQSQQQASKALVQLGWIGWTPNNEVKSFADLFSHLGFESPRPVQQEIIDGTASITNPALYIIEAPTGIGKTEVALYLADRALQMQQLRGIYVAMPTQATSNQMFQRVQDFLQHRYATDVVNLQLAHGNARYDADYQKFVLAQVGADDQTNGTLAAMKWFTEKSKQTLLAPFGVGTVDQALLSVLYTRHFFVRLFALAHKVVIFDEVHAYDTFMSTIFERLLHWLSALGCTVILLSATLPKTTRERLCRSFGVEPEKSDGYPMLTIAERNSSTRTIHLTPPTDIKIDINWIEQSEIVPLVHTEIEKDACLALVCNTVGEAQVVFKELEAARLAGDLEIEQDNLILFHARTTQIWRKETEDYVLQIFGKPQKDTDGNSVDHRPKRAIIVATQVIEQSLDLDFDVMITYLAPMDLLIQRAGRLQRHSVRDQERQGKFSRQLHVIRPEPDETGVPNFGKSQYVYEQYFLLRTYFELLDRQAWQLPSDTVSLIEAVYQIGSPNHSDAFKHELLKTAHLIWRANRQDAAKKASTQLIKRADDDDLLYMQSHRLEEDSPEIHPVMQAQTRDIGATVTFICLHHTTNCDASTVSLEPDHDKSSVDLNQKPWADLTSKLMQRKITTQNYVLRNYLADKAIPVGWKENSVLSRMRHIVFVNSVHTFDYDDETYQLQLSKKMGLELHKQENNLE